MEISKKNENDSLIFKEQMIDECIAMVRYAMANGSKIPGDVVESLEIFTSQQPAEANPAVENDMPTIRQLNAIHNRLARIISPAKPSAILLMDRERRKKGMFKFLGAVPFIRRMMLAAMISLALFVLISLSSDIGEKAVDLFEMSGITLLLNELFLLTAAGLGASFNALFKANRFIVNGTFDPKYETSYWIRFVLGILAGLLLATLVPIGEQLGKEIGEGAKAGHMGFEKPLLAMLGGFSANVVYQLFARLIAGVASVVKGDVQEQTDAKIQSVKNQADADQAKERFKVASQLMKLQDMLNSGVKTDDLKKQVGDLMKEMTGEYDDGSG